MAMLLNLLVLLAVILLGKATWNPRLTQSLDSDLDDQLCQTETHSRTIIDIHESMELGAELMDGVWKESLVECMSGCCATRGCDLALFKNVGISKTGKNCYYVHCGTKENCKIVPHTAFTSVLFLPRPSSTRNPIAGSSTPSVGHATPPSTPPSTTTKLPLSSAGTTSPQTHSTPSSEKSERGSTSTTITMTTEPTTAEELTPNSTASNSSLISSSGSQAKGGKGLASNAGKAVVPETVKPESVDDPCGQYGCDGSGIVAVVVVAVICFVIVLVVVAIMTKKAVTERRKRKFRNVDYLINGMYT